MLDAGQPRVDTFADRAEMCTYRSYRNLEREVIGDPGSQQSEPERQRAHDLPLDASGGCRVCELEEPEQTVERPVVERRLNRRGRVHLGEVYSETAVLADSNATDPHHPLGDHGLEWRTLGQRGDCRQLRQLLEHERCGAMWVTERQAADAGWGTGGKIDVHDVRPLSAHLSARLPAPIPYVRRGGPF